MSDIVNKALANLLAGQHQTNHAVVSVGQTVETLGQTVEKLGQAVGKLAVQGETQVVLIQELINAMEKQSANSVPLRQKVAELEERLTQVERKVS